ncbi:hypothetical protein DUI87_02662 [Hirundo rustica rustica]|uniref:ribonuclease H n=1 Tax=Hirundo rustica rustica TaxID=333673 RepID=A0A3M0L906_HIRRU|nr:hypothetical protein DUI87_02662 [Hirundo rustica rustica]
MTSPPRQTVTPAGTRLPSNQVPQGTGFLAPSNPEVAEQGTGADAAAGSCSIPTLAPVTYRNGRGGNNRAEYHPFPQATIKEICKAHRTYGRDGPYFKGLLRADLSAEEVVPADLKYLFSCFLNPMEYILWVTAWKQLLQDALPGLLNHVNTRVDAQGNPITPEHLAGEGQWAEATDQVVIPVQCLHVVRDTALTAFFSMQTQGPAISYSKIRQDQRESFTDFLERLSRAIEAQVKNEMAREHILTEIAFSNANDLCRAAILSLPLNPKPTLPDMLQKLKALEELVEEQLAKGHIVETTSPWNSLVFVIWKSGKDKWRFLQDLRQINNVIEDMGSLQPGMPSPTMLPQNWKLAVIDIKDCFFHIPRHPDDAPRVAFSVPTINREAPRKRYHWRVLPQGMKVSPIICQWYVASLLSPVRVAAEKAIIHHYMDDVLVCAPTNDVLSHALDLTIDALVVAGFELQEDKVQRMPPWRYLGLEIGKRTIVPQKLEIRAKIQTLADVHPLCGELNWVRPWLGLTTEDLARLFNLLKGGEELSSPRELTPEAKEALEKSWQNLSSASPRAEEVPPAPQHPPACQSRCTCLWMVGAPAQSHQGNGAGHKAIQSIRDIVNDIKRETGDWLNGLFGDWGILGWVGSILKSVLLFLFVILLISVGFGIMKKMLSRLISSTIHAPSVNQVAVSSAPGWEENVELEEDPKDRRHPEEEPQMEWPTQPEWLAESYPDFEYHPPPFQPSSYY